MTMQAPSDQGDEVGAGPAHNVVKLHHIPPLPLVEHLQPGPVIGLGKHGGGGAGHGTDVQITPAHIHHRVAGGAGLQEGQAKIFGEGQDDISGDGVQVVFHPGGVVWVVVVAQLQKDRRGPDQPHLPDGGGSLGPDLVGQGVDGLQAVGHQGGRLLAPDRAGEVEDDDPPHLAVFPLGGGIGVEGQMEIVVARVGGPDGGRGGHIGGVAAELNA